MYRFSSATPHPHDMLQSFMPEAEFGHGQGHGEEALKALSGFSLDALDKELLETPMPASEFPVTRRASSPPSLMGHPSLPAALKAPSASFSLGYPMSNHATPEGHSQAFLQSVLEQIFNIVRSRLSQPQFEAWIRPLVLRHMTETTLVFGTESAFHKNWIWKNYRSVLMEATEAVMGTGVEVQLQVLHEPSSDDGTMTSNTLSTDSSVTFPHYAATASREGVSSEALLSTPSHPAPHHGFTLPELDLGSMGFPHPEATLETSPNFAGFTSIHPPFSSSPAASSAHSQVNLSPDTGSTPHQHTSRQSPSGNLLGQSPLLQSIQAFSGHLQHQSSTSTSASHHPTSKQTKRKPVRKPLPTGSRMNDMQQISLGFPMGHLGQTASSGAATHQEQGQGTHGVSTTPTSSVVSSSSGGGHVPTQGASQGPYLWTPRMVQSNLNPRYTFDNFVVGQHARFCYAAAMAVAEKPAAHYNPFFVYGGVGLGKTHLIQAIGHSVLQRYPELVVRYVTAEVFTNELIARLSKKEDMRPFRDRYRNCDILIVDDVQFLEGKDRTQTEIFHTFNALYESGKQIILSSDRPPQALSILEERLRNRFEKGLIADIQPPDLETRIAILQNRLNKEHPQIPPLTLDILHYVADLYPKNIRELEGALTKIAAYFLLTQTPLELSTVQRILGGSNKATLTLDTILEVVSQYFHLSPKDILGSSRQKDIAHARHMAIFLMRDMTQLSFPKIGSFLSHRKHTTILYAYEKMKTDVVKHPHLKRQMQEILQRLNHTSS